VVAIFTDKILKGSLPVINGDGKQTRDYVYVGDVVKANVMGLDAKGPAIYNIGTSVETDVNYIFDKVNEFAGTGFMENHGPAKKGEQRRSVLSYEKIKKELGWKPDVNMAKGLGMTIEYFKKHKR